MSSNLLDQQQIIQKVYDPNQEKLKVDTGAVFTFSGEMEVNINATDDSVAIGDGTKTIQIGQQVKANSLPVTIASDQTVPVSISGTVPTSGTVSVSNFPATQAISATSLPLPTGAATEATLGTQSSFSTGAKSSVGASAVQMSTTSFATKKSVLIKAASTNTGLVYVGTSSAVTAGTTDATDGYELAASESVTIEINNQNAIWLIASASSQKVYFVAV